MDDQSPEPLEIKKLSYNIFSCSSHSSSYIPENILEDRPADQSSRWSSDTNNPPQFIVIKLEKPSIVSSLTFGKFEKTHVCNLKKFKMYGGLEEDTVMDLLESGLKNDNNPETFHLKRQLNEHYFPCQFIKIVPIQSWGPSFNFSIWYVGISGDDNQEIVKSAMDWHTKYREEETIKLFLKHFRQHNYLEAFESLEKKTKIQLEHPLLSELHNILVDLGDYEKTEMLITKALNDGLFSAWMGLQRTRPEWTALILPDDLTNDITDPTPAPATGAIPDTDHENIEKEKQFSTILFSVQPTNRGGHQMVLDSLTKTIYLFGGWDGNNDLADFWSFHIPTEKWLLLCPDTEADGGPRPRSCHKMVLDPVYRQIFVLGKYLERSLRDIPSNIKSDFHVYDIGTNKWTQITDDTAAMGGPSLIFDHQMCLDASNRDIYVFGGQSLHLGTNENLRMSEKKYSGLFVYHISTGSWKLIQDDCASLMSRTGHSMLFHPGNRKLYIFGGQRKKEDDYLLDFFTYNVDDGMVEFLADRSSSQAAIPAVGYTHRATIDWKRNEIHVTTGLNKDKEKEKRAVEVKVSNSFWVYDINERRWSCTYRNENVTAEYWSQQQMLEPRPRYAHQLVYDEESMAHFMFGGNPGGKKGKEGRLRLGDFWRLVLRRPSSVELERKCRLMIRENQFKELALNKTPKDALTYLQSHLSECVNHKSKDEEHQFHLLAGQIFQSEEDQTHHQLRYNLFNALVNFFPEEMTQPQGNLIDLIPLHQKQTSPQPKLF